jgi:arylsulfatase A-like enzyme
MTLREAGNRLVDLRIRCSIVGGAREGCARKDGDVSQPNVLWIFSDQHRPHAMGCYGDPNVPTPNLDRLAAEGMRFTRAYSNAPLCSPFRACLYTGQTISTHGVISLHRPLLPRQPVLPEVLRERGYHTAHMGKWHLSGGAAPCHFVSGYFRPGWDEWIGWENSNEPFATEYHTGESPRPLRTLDGYQTDALTGLAIEWLRDGRPTDRPWVLVLSVEPPHPPNEAPEAYMRRFADTPLELPPNFDADHPKAGEHERRLRGYYAQIANLDDNVGRLLAALEQTGQLDETIIFYFADHGDLMGSHGRMGKSRPEEESSRIPLLVCWPGRVPAGAVSDALIGGIDLMPTLLGLLGIEVPPGVEGRDLAGAITRDEAGPDSLLIQYETTFFPFTPRTVFRCLQTPRWTYGHFLVDGPTHLYDLEADPWQMQNLIDSPDHAAVRAELAEMLRQRLAALGDDFLERRADQPMRPPAWR